MKDFRGNTVEVGDIIVYVGRQDMKAFLTEGLVTSCRTEVTDNGITVKPLRSSNPLGQPTGRLVNLSVERKVAVVSKG